MMTDIPLPDLSGFVPQFDNTQADTEGWAIFECSGSQNGTFQICKCDDQDTFEDDEKAWAHVVGKAREGSEYHRNALIYIRQHNPIEFHSIGAVFNLNFL